jgi:cytochrome c oxidase subunit 1
MVMAMTDGGRAGSWVATVWQRPTQRAVPMHWMLGLVLLLAAAPLGVGDFSRTVPGTDRALHDTYYVVAHFHYVLSLAVAFAFFAAWYYLFPKVTGRRYSEVLGRLHFWLTFSGVGVALFVGALLTLQPARVLAHPEDFAYWNGWSSVGSYLAAAGTLVFVAAMAHALLTAGRGHG